MRCPVVVREAHGPGARLSPNGGPNLVGTPALVPLRVPSSNIFHTGAHVAGPIVRVAVNCKPLGLYFSTFPGAATSSVALMKPRR